MGSVLHYLRLTLGVTALCALVFVSDTIAISGIACALAIGHIFIN